MKKQSYYVDLPETASESEMAALAKALEPVVLAQVRLVKRMAFEVSDKRAAEIIEVVLSGRSEAQPVKKAAAPESGMSRASFRFKNGEHAGEVITTQALNKRLRDNDGSLKGLTLENYKGQSFIVMPDDDGVALMLIREPQP